MAHHRGRGGNRGGNRSQNQNQNQSQNQNQNHNQNHNRNHNGGQGGNQTGEQKTIRVQGWTTSRASNDADRGLAHLLSFLTRKASNARIISHRVHGDVVYLQVNAHETVNFTHCNNYTFNGTKISVDIVPSSQQNNQTQSGQNQNQRQHDSGNNRMNNSSNRDNQTGRQSADHMQTDAAALSANEVENVLVSVIRKRLVTANKFLNLEHLVTEPDFQRIGLHQESANKVFTALFVCCERKVFESRAKRQQMVESLGLNNNGLASVKDVITAGSTFNHIKNLDLSNNVIKDIHELRYWRNRFPSLEHLILTGNPVDDDPNTKLTMLKWYPNLKFYNREPVDAANDPIVLDQPANVTSLTPAFPKPTEPHPEFGPDSTFAINVPGKPELQCTQEQMELRFSYETVLKMSWARDCLQSNNYDYDRAMADYQRLSDEGKIPLDAWLSA